MSTLRQKLRRRRKDAGITLGGGETARQPVTQGARKPAEDPRLVVLSKRLRDCGDFDQIGAAIALASQGKSRRDDFEAGMAKAEREAAMKKTDVMLGCEVGRCIRELNANPSAWAIWRHMLSAHWNYCRLVLGTTGQARIGAPGYIPERLETDDNHTIDIRTQEERIEGARRAWGAFSGQIASLPTPMHQWAIRDAITQREGLCWSNGRPTARGKLVVAALGLMAGAKEKRE